MPCVLMFVLHNRAYTRTNSVCLSPPSSSSPPGRSLQQRSGGGGDDVHGGMGFMGSSRGDDNLTTEHPRVRASPKRVMVELYDTCHGLLSFKVGEARVACCCLLKLPHDRRHVILVEAVQGSKRPA